MQIYHKEGIDRGKYVIVEFGEIQTSWLIFKEGTNLKLA